MVSFLNRLSRKSENKVNTSELLTSYAENITTTRSNFKKAAIWARVSTHDQKETSLPSQIDRCKERLLEAGYTITHLFQTDWSSMDLFSCPQFQELRRLIMNSEIQALAIFDRDRLQARGLQRLVFLSECKEAKVELIICQGPPMLEEPEGQLMELALAIGKERQVLRARQGSRDGLHDRATKRRLPTTYHKIYGLKWDIQNNSLLRDENAPAVDLIFRMLLEGNSYTPIIRELKRQGIFSPAGHPAWNKTTLSAIVHNPVYAGRYYALKNQAVEPKKRRGNTYGNSSCRKLPLDEAHYIPEIKVAEPFITWEQRQQILEQLAKHQKLAQRNAHRDYLLRGMIFCETHRGKNGEPRRYHGQPHGKAGRWRYVCPIGGCIRPYLSGREIEQYVKKVIIGLVTDQPNEYYLPLSGQFNQDFTEETLHRELHSLRQKYTKIIDDEVKLEERILAGKVTPEAEKVLKDKLKIQREWIKKEEAIKLNQLDMLSREDAAKQTLAEMRRKYGERMKDDRLTQEEWRRIFIALNLSVHVLSEQGKQEAIDKLITLVRSKGYGMEDKAVKELTDEFFKGRKYLYFTDISIDLGIPIKIEEIITKVGKIVLESPAPD